jgi:hypothetical protein
VNAYVSGEVGPEVARVQAPQVPVGVDRKRAQRAKLETVVVTSPTEPSMPGTGRILGRVFGFIGGILGFLVGETPSSIPT